MELIVRLIAWAPGGNLGRAPVKGIDQGTRINSRAGSSVAASAGRSLAHFWAGPAHRTQRRQPAAWT